MQRTLTYFRLIPPVRISLSVAALLQIASLVAAETPAPDFTLLRKFGPKQRLLQFAFEFAPHELSDGMGLDRIMVTGLSHPQTLRIDLSESGLPPENYRERTEWVDLNGDGFEDLLVPNFLARNSGYFVWIYQKASDEFIFCSELSSEANPEARGKGIVETSSGDTGRRSVNTYRWTGKRFELISIWNWVVRQGVPWESSQVKKEGKWVVEYSRKAETE